MRVFLAILLMVIAGYPVLAERWVTTPGPVAIVYTHPGETHVARIINSMAGEEYIRIAAELGLTESPLIPIFAYTNSVEFLQDAGPRPLLVGVSYRPSGLIRIDVTGKEGPVRDVLAHELTHSLLNAKLGPNIGSLPDWVNEGIAGYLSSPLSVQQLAGITHLRGRDGIISLQQMAEAFSRGESTAAAYTQSCSMIAWLEYHHPGALTALLDAMAVGRPFEDSLQRVVGFTPEEWLHQWTSGMPLFEVVLQLLASPVVFSPMAVIVAILAFLRAKRKREEREEDEQNNIVTTPTLPPFRLPQHDLAYLAQLAKIPILDDIHTCARPNDASA